VIQDLRFALRSIWRSKLFTLTALAAFSFGIGATATVYSVIDAVLLHPATFRDVDSVVSIRASEKDKTWGYPNPGIYDRLRSRHDLFAEVAGSRRAVFTVTRVPVPDQIFGLTVSGSYFRMLDAHAWQGRVLLPEDERPGAKPVALLSYRAWKQVFAGDPAVLGKTAEIDGELHTVVGIMAPNFVLPGSDGMLWTTLRVAPAELIGPNARWIEVIARLQPRITRSRAQAALDIIAATPTSAGLPPQRLQVSPWQGKTDEKHRLTLWLAMGMVSGLLVIACANLSSVLLARAIGRQRDYAIRLATGAGRARLIRQSLMEIGLIALAALPIACAGTSVVLQAIRDYLASVQTGIPNLARIELNGHSLWFSFAVALMSALICGFLPALSATSVDLSTGLRESGTEVAGTRRVRRLLHSLIAVEAGVSMLLLLTSGLLVRSLVRLMADDHGVKADHVLTLGLPTGSWQGLATKQTEDDRQRRIQQYLTMMRQAAATPGVQAAALSSSLPLSRSEVRTRVYNPHRANSSDASDLLLLTRAVTRDYFRVMGIPLLSGRGFESRDAASRLHVAMVNQAFVRKYFPNDDPIGKYLTSPDHSDATEMIGVVKDSPQLDFNEAVQPEVYFDFEQTLLTPFLTGLVVRTDGDPVLLIAALRNALSRANASQAVVQVQPLRTLIDENVWQPRFSAWLFSAFAFLALCLSGIGIYGVVAYVTASRRRDFGIRLAIGADPMSLFRMATVQGVLPVLIGAAAGTLASFWTSKWIASLLYKTNPFDAVIVIASAAVLLLMSLAATFIPALRAARVDPAITLRGE
jgi:predicted permease